MSSAPLCLPHIFRRAEQLYAEKTVATATPAGVQRTTYGEIAARTRRLAGALDALGLGKDARVATFGWNTARHLELYFAVPCSGRMLHTLNIRLSPEHLTWIINDAEDEVIFADRSLLGNLNSVLDQVPSVRHVIVMNDRVGETALDQQSQVIDYEDLIASAEPFEFVDTDEQRAAAMCYTSGTTGRPKGVVYSHRSIVLHSLGVMAADSLGLSESDVILPVVPMFHVNAWGLPHAAAMTGASLVMPGSDLSGGGIAALLESERVTLTAGVPTIWQSVLNELEGRDVRSLRLILCGGAAMPMALSERYRQRVGLPLTQAWGMTETSPVAAVCRIKTTLYDESPEQQLSRRGTIGPPLPLVEARIVDPDTGCEQPRDGLSSGELQVRGPWVASAYYGNSGASQFTADGWLLTGDIARMDNHGYIRLLDRSKDLVKSGGEWISSVELENEIMAHPDVKEAAVIAIPDVRWGERPLACVVVAEGRELDAEDVRAFLVGRVAKWWIPEQVLMLEELPKTSVGKFAKRELRERYASGPR